MPRVRIKNGPAKGQLFEIGADSITIGREPTCVIQVLDKGASRNHCEIFRIGEMCFIRDLQSRNGTFLNDARVDEELLRDEDRIQIGATILVFESVEGSARNDDSGVEFADDDEEDFGSTLELRLEDLSAANVGEGDGQEAARLRALYRLGRILAEERDEKALVDNVLPFVCDQLRADIAFLFTREPQKGTIVPIGNYSATERKGGKVSRSIIRRAIQEKRALLTSDAMSDNRFSSQDSIMMKQIHSVICVPVSVLGDLSGVLYLASDNPGNSFTEEELELSAAMADQLGLALSHVRMQKRQRENLVSTIGVLVRATELKDPKARGHSERMARYSVQIGRELGLSLLQLEHLELAALLHNIGKLIEGAEDYYGLEDTAAGLSEREKQVLCALEIISEMDVFSNIEKAIRYQLERNDGSGPQKLTGDAIPIAARILAVACEFDRIANDTTSDEPAEEKVKKAVLELSERAGKDYDEDVVKALLIVHRNGNLHVAIDSDAEDDSQSDPDESSADE